MTKFIGGFFLIMRHGGGRRSYRMPASGKQPFPKKRFYQFQETLEMFVHFPGQIHCLAALQDCPMKAFPLSILPDANA